MSFDQGQFDFDAGNGEGGYHRWRQKLDAQKRAFEARHGVILGTKVQLQLRDFASPLTGTIHLVQKRSTSGNSKPLLQIGSVQFSPDDVESVLRLDPEP